MLVNSVEEQNLFSHINRMEESEIRSVLEYIALIHPEVVHSALRHGRCSTSNNHNHDMDDLHSVDTTPTSNTSSRVQKNTLLPPPPPRPTNARNKGFPFSHPSKMRTRDGDDDDKTVLPPPHGNSHGISRRHQEILMESFTDDRSDEFQPPRPPKRSQSPLRSPSL
jgi:hypothetical protein